MPFILWWLTLPVVFCVGAVIGFCDQWRHSKPHPVSVVYCTRASTEPRCTKSIKEYDLARASASARISAPLPPFP